MSAGTEHMRGVMLILADLLLENFIRVALFNCQHLSLTLQSTGLLLVLMSAGFSRVFRGSGSESQGQSGAEWSDINTVRKLIKMQLNVIIAVGVHYLRGWEEARFRAKLLELCRAEGGQIQRTKLSG